MSASMSGKRGRPVHEVVLMASVAIGLSLAGLCLAGPAHARSITRGEIMARAWSAQYTPYGQTGHYKSYAPDEYYDEGGETSDEPYIDCSGLVQKAWQIPDQIYPGQWNPPSVPAVEYPAASFTSNGSYWTVIAQGALATGDAHSNRE